nr:MAG TPA: Putative membrane protein [Caudoviricetes sp.]
MFLFGTFVVFFLVIFVTVASVAWIAMLLVLDTLRKRGYL